jgi:FkbM family methyltransferase
MRIIDLLFSSQILRKRIVSRAQIYHLSNTLAKLQSKGISPQVVFDVGARTGEWSKNVRKVLKHSEFFLFEATEGCREQLSNSGFKFFITVLSDSQKEVDFYENGTTGDSYYKEHTAFYKNVRPAKKQTTDLDCLVAAEGIRAPDLIKLDTQGSELDILDGAQRTLKNTSLIYIECPIIEYNLGAPRLTDYLQYMRELGYLPFEICEQHFGDDILLQVDIMFIKKSVYEKYYPKSRRTFYGF